MSFRQGASSATLRKFIETQSPGKPSHTATEHNQGSALLAGATARACHGRVCHDARRGPASVGGCRCVLPLRHHLLQQQPTLLAPVQLNQMTGTEQDSLKGYADGDLCRVILEDA